jgi:hypothetical protein
MLDLRAEALAQHRAVDVVAAALGDEDLAPQAERAARDVLVPLGGELTRLTLARRSDELSAKAEVRARGTSGLARVGVRPP